MSEQKNRMRQFINASTEPAFPKIGGSPDIPKTSFLGQLGVKLDFPGNLPPNTEKTDKPILNLRMDPSKRYLPPDLGYHREQILPSISSGGCNQFPRSRIDESLLKQQ